MFRFVRSVVPLLIASGTTACGAGAPAPNHASTAPVARRAPPHTSAKAEARPAERPTLCTYRVQAPAKEPFVVRVSARCEGGKVTSFVPDDERVARFVRAADATRDPHEPFRAEQTGAAAELVYDVDLDGLARSLDRSELAARFGSSLLAAASSFLLRPEPAVDSVPVRVYFSSPGAYATGLRPSGDHFAIESHELHTATYTAFGVREMRDLDRGGARVRVVRLDGAFDASFDTLTRWVSDAASAVQTFYARVPDPNTTVFLAPVADHRQVLFGKLLPESAPGVVVMVGEHAAHAELYGDWVLVHELFHIGSPSFLGEGKWLDEGLATYFEPIIRARAGWIREEDVWSEFFTYMPRGLTVMTESGLETASEFGDVYWGGGLFCLLADVRIRQRTDNAKGLEDGVRAVLAAGGTSSEVWSLADSLRVAEDALSVPVLSELVAQHSAHGSPLDLAALFRDLGVVKRGTSVRLNDKSPLAAVRRAIVSGGRAGR